MNLYKWQEACLTAWTANGHRGIVHVMTGAGKTVLAIAAMEQLMAQHPDLHVLIVVPTVPLAAQWKHSLLRHTQTMSEMPGFYGGSRRDHQDRQIVIYILNSARTALSKHIRQYLALGQPVLLICDECHHAQSPENRHIFDFVTSSILDNPRYCSLGLSATPFSDEAGAAYLQAMLGKEIYRYGASCAARDQVIAPYTVCALSTDFLPEEQAQYNMLSAQLHKATEALRQQYPALRKYSEVDFLRQVTVLARQAGEEPDHPAVQWLKLCYQRKEITVLAQARLRCCLDLVERLSPDDRVLVFCERIEQAEALHHMLRNRFGASVCTLYHSRLNHSARSRNMDAFRDGSARILVTCRCLDEGIDVPDANIGIILSGSSVERQRIQRLGRIIRQAEGKDAACLYYIYVRGSSENRAYLPGLQEDRCFELEYLPLERDFCNDLYEYAARELFESALQSGWPNTAQKELRRCLAEGLTRADYLLPAAAQRRHMEQAFSMRERNYWHTMLKIGRYFDTEGDKNP